MKTIEAKNEEARSLVEMSIESPSMVRDLMYAVEGDPDFRLRSLVGYHLMRGLLDDGTFTPEEALEMENVQRPFSPSCWRLPYAAMFPAYSAFVYTFAAEEGEELGSDGFIINLCAFVEKSPVIGFRYACRETYGNTMLVKGLVPYNDEELQARYPDWEFYEADSAATDDMTAFLTRNFGHVFRVEIAHLDKTDGRLHRIYMSNE